MTNNIFWSIQLQEITSLLAKLYTELALSKELPSATVPVVDCEGTPPKAGYGGLDQELVVADVPVVFPVPVDVLAVI